MARENILRVRVDDETHEAIALYAKINKLPKAVVALHFLLEGLDPYLQIRIAPQSYNDEKKAA